MSRDWGGDWMEEGVGMKIVQIQKGEFEGVRSGRM